MSQNQILLCSNSMEGIFSGIYYAYEHRFNPQTTHLMVEDEAENCLFSTYHQIENNEEHFIKVRRTLMDRLGTRVFEGLCRAMAVEEEGIADAVYHTVVKGLGKGYNNGPRVLDDLADKYVQRIFAYARKSSNEIHYFKEFLRFQELRGKEPVLYSRIGPKTNIVTFLGPHFADRFPNENFIIHDCWRNFFLIHPKQKEWYVIVSHDYEKELFKRFSVEEYTYQNLFKSFHETIAIKERINPKLQMNMLPLRYRDFMVEFQTGQAM